MQTFWEIADSTRVYTEFLADKRLQSLRTASLSSLQKIFVQYRFFTIYYISDMAMLVQRLPFGTLRSLLAEFLNDELGNGDAADAHPRLYDDFLVSIGTDAALRSATAIPANLKLLEDISKMVNEGSPAQAVGLRGLGGECLCQLYLAAMHAHFVENPVIKAIADQIDWKFWEIHIGDVDIAHRIRLRAAIDEEMARAPELADDIRSGYEFSKHAWDVFWVNIFEAEAASNQGASAPEHSHKIPA
jgi:hypothetical protein